LTAKSSYPSGNGQQIPYDDTDILL
jgi:hypothetical protein